MASKSGTYYSLVECPMNFTSYKVTVGNPVREEIRNEGVNPYKK